MSDCNHQLEYAYTIDEVRPFGEITSIAVFKCTKCGEEFLEGELNDKRRTNRIFPNKSN